MGKTMQNRQKLTAITHLEVIGLLEEAHGLSYWEGKGQGGLTPSLRSTHLKLLASLTFPSNLCKREASYCSLIPIQKTVYFWRYCWLWLQLEASLALEILAREGNSSSPVGEAFQGSPGQTGCRTLSGPVGLF